MATVAARAFVTPTVGVERQQMLGSKLSIVTSLPSVSYRGASGLVVRAGSGLPSPTKVGCIPSSVMRVC